MNYRLLIRDRTTGTTVYPWRELDLGGERPAMNYQINTLAELKDRQASYSQAIKMPKTQRNLRELGYLDHIDVINSVAYAPVEACLECDGFVISPPGALLYIDRVATDIEAQIVSATFDFFAILEQTPMSADGIDGFTFPWSAGVLSNNSNGVVTLPNGIQARYLEAFTDFHAGQDMPAGRPARTYRGDIRAHFIHLPFIDTVREILRQKGYTLDTDIIESNKTWVAPIAAKTYIGNGVIFSGVAQARSFTQTTIGNTIPKPWINDRGVGSQRMAADGMSPEFVALQDCIITLKEEFEIEYQGNGGVGGNEKPLVGRTITVYNSDGSVAAGGNIVGEPMVDYPPYPNNTTGSSYAQTYEIGLLKGQYVRYFTYDSNYAGRQIYKTLGITVELIVTDTKNNEALIGGQLDLLASTGVSNAKEFFQIFLQTYGLTVDIDYLHKVVRAYTFSKFYQNKSQAVDWTDKIEIGREDVTFTIGNFAQRNFILNKENSNDTGFTDRGGFVVSDLTLTAEKELFTIGVESGRNVESSWGTHDGQGGFTPSVIAANYPVWEKVNEVGEPVKFEYRGGTLMHLVEMTTQTEQFYIGQGTILKPVRFNWARHPRVQKYIDTFYADLINKLLTNARMLKVRAMLSPLDINQLDLFTPVKIRGLYFYISKISNYVAGRPTEIDLIKM